MLSYDWLKIIAAIAAAVLLICVFFTTVQTRPRPQQVFTVYGYRELLAGAATEGLDDDLLDELSYDVLKAEIETFGTGEYSDAAFTARRSASLGTVMFTTTNKYIDAQGNETTVLESVAGGETAELALDLEQYFADCRAYLERFFGEDLGSLNKEEARACFMKRNGEDRRFRTQQKLEEGVLEEYSRLERLKEDYLFVLSRFESGLIEYSFVTDKNGQPRANAIALGKLQRLSEFYYYNEISGEETVRTSRNIVLFFFRNDNDAGKPAAQVTNDLRYEPVSFLRYLIKEYGE